MKLKSLTERGQALILITLAAIGLFAITGLAIDGSAKFSDRRHAQNAADTAALAGALAKINEQKSGGSNSPITCPPPSGYTPSDICTAILDAARERATENGYDGDLVRSVVGVYRPPISGIYADCSDTRFDCNDYIQVIISSNVDTFFARVIGINQTHNQVEAVASTVDYYQGGLFGGNSVVALNPTGGGCALTAGGSGTTTIVGGGLFSNSSSSCAFDQNGCAGSIEINGGSGTLTTVGGMNFVQNCAASVNAVKIVGADPYSFPPDELPEPSECSTAGSHSSSGSTTTLTPGYFDAIPGSGGSWKSNVVLTPGIYCIGTQLKFTTGTLTVQGTYGVDPGVFIYFKAGGHATPISFQGADIQLWPYQTSGGSGDYAGYLMYVAPDYTDLPTSCKINGSSTQELWGTIYAPYCDIDINGTSASGFHSQLVGYTVDLSGSANVSLIYNQGDNAVKTIPWQVGLTK